MQPYRVREFREFVLAEARARLPHVRVNEGDVDFHFAAERLRERKYAYSEEELKRHFPLEAVLQGAFRMASFLFGGLYILHMYIPSGMNLAVKELYKMAPYVVTIVVLVISSLRNKREHVGRKKANRLSLPKLL